LDVSLVIPCYNEAPHLRASVSALCEILDATRFEYEVVFVDDMSADETRSVIEDICANTPRCRYIFHEQNRGRGAAFKTGFVATTGEVTGFLDIDLEVGAHYVVPLVELILHHGVDVATGHRHYLFRQTHALHRAALSWVYRRVLRASLAPNVEDSETGCKFFRRSTATCVVLGSESDGWFWDSEVMARAVLADLRIQELPVLFLRRWDKKSTVRLVHDIAGYLADLHKFRGKFGMSLLGKSPIYWDATGFDLVMRSLYGPALDLTYSEVAERIEGGTSVVDLCCGTARLFRDHLQTRGCAYVGLDFNSQFVLQMRRKGVSTRFFNALTDEVPSADYVTMISSFYHFRRNAGEVLARMKASAQKAVIISEPVQNLTNHASPLGPVAAWLTNPGVGDFDQRFDLSEFKAFAEAHGATEFSYREGDRNAVAVFAR
jgi:glycosyltransferase involved in cell wall biosynthesis